jgi:ABC-type antimicrobial peptide transport system permease subunit
MLINYLKIALRSLWRNKLFSAINIVSLAISMAVGVGMILSLKANFDTDHFHPYFDRTYRVLTTATNADGQSRWATVPQPLSGTIRSMHRVEQTVEVRHGSPVRVKTDKGDITVNTTFTEPSFFHVFGFTLTTGNAQQALTSPTAVLLSQRTARQLFGDQSPLGQSIQFDGLGWFTVAGVIQQPPLRTHLPVEAVFSLQTAQSLEKAGHLPALSTDWQQYQTTSLYALLRSSDDIAPFNNVLSQLGRSFQRDGQKIQLNFTAQTLESITPWDPAIRNDMHAGINWSGIRSSLFLIAVLTVLAAFNYVSLSLARSLTRAREVGIRKANGALRWQLFSQFLVESSLIAVFSLGLGLFLWYTVIQSGWLPQAEDINTVSIQYPIGWLVLYAVLTGLVAGAIPATLLTRFQPVQVLRNLQTIRLFQGVGIYRLLIVIQFAVTTMLMVFLVVLRDAGTQTEDQLSGSLPTNVVLLALRGEAAERLKPQIEQLAQVDQVTATDQVALYSGSGVCSLKVANEPVRQITSRSIDAQYVPVFGLALQAGQNIPAGSSTGSSQYVLVNEALARQLPGHSPKKAVGQRIRIDSTDRLITGVLVEPAGQVAAAPPTVYQHRIDRATILAAQTRPGSEAAVLVAIQRVWKQQVPDRLPEVYVYDEKVHQDFAQGFRTLNLFFGFFCGLVMLIACLGILGLSAYIVEVRTREIGIRRVVGASDGTIVWTLSKTFINLLLWAGLFGLPAGWFCGTLLRQRVSTQVDLGPANLLLGFGLVALVGILTILSQTFQATRIKPADVLRSE